MRGVGYALMGAGIAGAAAAMAWEVAVRGDSGAIAPSLELMNQQTHILMLAIAAWGAGAVLLGCGAIVDTLRAKSVADAIRWPAPPPSQDRSVRKAAKELQDSREPS